MPPLPGSHTRVVTLDDLAALNREMAELVRGGLPLEAGLRHVAQDYSSGVSRLATRLAEATTAGKSLAQALAEEGDALPPTYRAVVAAGMRTGHLAGALEGFADTAARVAELRRIAAQAAVYPIMVIIIAWVMAVFTLSVVMPQYDWLDIAERFWAPTPRLSGRAYWALVVGPPIALLLLAAIWWRRSARAGTTLGAPGFMRWIPGVGRALHLGGQANFADLLQMLVGCRVPLTEALPLAARASGVTALVTPAEELADQLTAGQPLTANPQATRRMPPLVRTALLTGGSETTMLANLRQAAEIYRDRAASWIADVSVMLPVGLTLLLGVGVVGTYTFLLLQPYSTLLYELAGW